MQLRRVVDYSTHHIQRTHITPNEHLSVPILSTQPGTATPDVQYRLIGVIEHSNRFDPNNGNQGHFVAYVRIAGSRL
jgi:hypothetical protein